MTFPETMCAMVTMGHGGLDQLQWREDWPRPVPQKGEVLVRVKACGLNNTDINTRVGWYSQGISSTASGNDQQDPSWGGAPISFPRIQGADACGEIVDVGPGVSKSRIGARVITDNWLRDPTCPGNKGKAAYFGSECDGGFAEFTCLPNENAVQVRSGLRDAELATFSCSFSTALGMLTRAEVGDADTVLIPGASGGVGGALVQLAKLRGARVIAMASASKHAAVAELGPDLILPRAPEDLRAALGDERVTVVADVVGGPGWPALVDVLERGGRLTCSGAIAGPHVNFDLRTFYLRDLTFTGSTVTDPSVMRTLVNHIEAAELRPLLAASFPLKELAAAQTAFAEKTHAGNIVVLP
ncbi:MAG: alcohol dehydrogenase family protein [Pseudomonadota bacterium]